MRTRNQVVGIDSSTQSCKAVWVDADTGQVLRSRSAPHPEGSAVDPEAWWRALESLEIEDEPVLAIGVAGQQHGMIALDEAGSPVHDALLWNDTRSAPQAEQLLRDFGLDYWTHEMGMAPVASLTVTKLAWLAQNLPERAARVNRVLLPHDWLTHRLRGGNGLPSTDRSDASGTGYYSVQDEAYRLALLDWALGHVPELPRVAAPFELVGETRGGAALSPGAGDNAAAALGLGVSEGEVVVSLGTSGTVFASTRTRVLDPQGAIAGFADAQGGYLPIAVTLNAARVLDATRRMLGLGPEEFDRLAMEAPVSGGPVLVPYLDGERGPNLPDATGAFIGMTRANMEAGAVARAAVVGMLCGIAENLDNLRARGIAVSAVTLIGGAARSRSVRALAPEIFGLPVRVPEPAEYVALGAARQAATALRGAPMPAPAAGGDELLPPGSGRGGWAEEAFGAFLAARERLYPDAWI